MKKNIFYLGIDGGGTKTDLALGDGAGNIIRSITVKSCNPIDIGLDAAKEILKEGIFKICEGIPFSDVCMFAGIAGGVSMGMKEKLESFFEEFGFLSFANDSDNKNIIAAGLGEQDGITLILGTGICAYVQKNKEHKRISGWGYIIDDGGSGYNLGRDALSAYFCALDGRREKTVLTEEIEKIYPGDTEKLMEYIYRGGKKAVASFAPAVFSAYEKEDIIAKEIIERNVKEAATVLKTAAKEFSCPEIPVVIAGGLTKQPVISWYLKEYTENKFDIKVMRAQPVMGAVTLAMKLKEKGE